MLLDWGAYIFEGLIHGGAYFRNFTVGHCLHNDVILLYYYHNEQGFALLCKLELLLFKPHWDNQNSKAVYQRKNKMDDSSRRRSCKMGPTGKWFIEP